MVLLVQTERIKEALKRYSSLNLEKDISEYLKSDIIPHSNPEHSHLSKMRSIAEEMNYQRLIGIQDPYCKNKELSRSELRLIKNQIFTIINILVSIFSIIIAIWIWCKSWAIPMRIIAALSSGLVIAIAEIVVYNHYLSSIQKRQEFERKRPAKKEIINTTRFEGRKNT
ncbi:hypothetical protein MERGE_001795 [Pneumocystis wakefieldiae]|uniref:Uncharacterized protein n=1 Tax=Pneumocystis wakefieldiae TaxID=38082 RepID=A0A899FW06_9ASCO|nr:hypothetical protein MERGE_001795 [Pneumocystis wakefieldiae]